MTTTATDGNDDADQAARDGASRTARVAGRRACPVGVEALIGLHTVGATADYRRAMEEAGFPSRSADDLTGARAVGLTPDDVRTMRAAGLRARADDLIGARASGLDLAYIAALRRLGVDGSLDDVQGMHAVSATPRASEVTGREAST